MAVAEAAALVVEDLVAGYGEVTVLEAVSLAARPRLVLLDEPASGLPENELPELGDLIRDLAAEAGVVVIEHRMDLVMSVCDTIFVLDFGKLIADGSPAQVQANPAVTAAYLGAEGQPPEGQGVITELTVEENLRLGGLTRRGGAARSAALADAYQRFPLLAERKRRLAGTMSGGERQILVIARALMAAPRVLLLDEPSLGLAPRMVTQVMELVRRLRDDSGLTVLLVEQNARSALAIADHGLVLNLGKVVADDDASTLSADVALRRHYLGF